MEKMENLFRVDDIKVDMPSKVLSDNVAKIAVIGVGGGGCNMINHMINEGSHKIDLIAANTDLQVLHISKAPKKIHSQLSGVFHDTLMNFNT
jgi:cell division protein FtsZ